MPLVQGSHLGGGRVRQHGAHAALPQDGELRSEAVLLGGPEARRSIRGEVRRLRDGHVGRIEVGEVPATQLARDLGEIGEPDFGDGQRLVRRAKHLDVENAGARVLTERHVEVALRIDAPETVEARLVEEEQARAPVDGAHLLRGQRTHGIEALAALVVPEAQVVVLVALEAVDERLDVELDGLVERDELCVLVREQGAFEPADGLGREREEHRASTAERLGVRGEPTRRQTLHEAVEKARFASRPLHDRTRYHETFVILPRPSAQYSWGFPVATPPSGPPRPPRPQHRAGARAGAARAWTPGRRRSRSRRRARSGVPWARSSGR